MRSLHDLELLQAELASKDSEAAKKMAKRVQTFAKALREEFIPGQAIPCRVFAPASPPSTLPQRKSKGKAKGRTLTSREMAERRGRSKRPKASVGENETQDCIQVIWSTAPV